MFKYYLLKNLAVLEIDEPIGWDKFESVLKRSARHGVQVEFSEVQLTFHCGTGGYQWLASEYNTHGSDGEIKFRQTFLCNGTETTLYEANLNFNTLSHVRGEYIEVNCENVSFGNKLQTREKTRIGMLAETDLDGNAISPAEPIRTSLHSRAMVKQFKATEADPADAYYSTPVDTLFILKGWGNIENDEISDTYHYSTNWQETNPTTASEWLIDVKEDGLYTFDIDISFLLLINTIFFLDNLEFRWILRIDGTEYPLSNAINSTGTTAPYNSGVVRSTITHTQQLSVGQKVYLFAFMTHGDSGPTQHNLSTNYPTNRISISALTTTNDSAAKVWPVADVLKRLVYAATGLPNRFKSDYFTTGCGKNYLLTSGFAIRQFPDADLSISRADAWEGLNPVFALGEGLGYDGSNEVVELEPVPYFYQASEILKIDYPTDYLEEVAGEYIYNTAEFGYEKSNTDEFNALDEFNTTREYQTPVKTSENKLTAVSKFVASMYAIESQRRKPYTEGSKVSATFDKDTFLISAKPGYFTKGITDIGTNALTVSGLLVSGGITMQANTVEITGTSSNNGTYTVTAQKILAFPSRTVLTLAETLPDPGATAEGYAKVHYLNPERNEIFESVSGLISPETMYNGRISPLRNALRWGPVLNSGLWFKKPYQNNLRFTVGEGNTEFTHRMQAYETCLEGDPDRLELHENDSLQLASINRFQKLWKPEYITFKAPLTAEDMQLIRAAHMPQLDAAQKYGYISVWDGEQYQQGYLLELRYKNADEANELSTFKLIKKADSPINQPGSGSTAHLEFTDEFSTEFN